MGNESISVKQGAACATLHCRSKRLTALEFECFHQSEKQTISLRCIFNTPLEFVSERYIKAGTAIGVCTRDGSRTWIHTVARLAIYEAERICYIHVLLDRAIPTMDPYALPGWPKESSVRSDCTITQQRTWICLCLVSAGRQQ